MVRLGWKWKVGEWKWNEKKVEIESGNRARKGLKWGKGKQKWDEEDQKIG